MEELKHLTHPRSLLPLTNVLEKIVQSIKRQKLNDNVKEDAIKEIDFLKEQCLSENVRLSLLSCQSLYCLVESGVLQPANVLTMFISMLSNASNAEQSMAISEGIINLLLFDMKQRSVQNKSERYQCPFGLRTPQHPMIMLLQKKNSNIIDLANKMSGICNHRNKFIRSNSLEFLRPVYTFVLCNPAGVPESKSVWDLFLANVGKSRGSIEFLYDIIGWMRIASPASCLQLTILITETIDHLMIQKQFAALVDFQIYLVALIPTIINHCNDPRPSLSCILRTIEECPDASEWSDTYFSYLLITMAQLLHEIPPFYFSDGLRVIKYLIDNSRKGNAIIRQIILDGLLVRLAVGIKALPNDAVIDARNLINALKVENIAQHSPSKKNEQVGCKVRYFHPQIANNFGLVELTEELCSKRLSVTALLAKVVSNDSFCVAIQYVLRGLLLMEGVDFLSANEWRNILECLLKVARNHEDVSTDLLYFILYLIAKEEDGKKQLALLQAMTTFATVKENVPLILNTYRALSTSTPALRTLSLNLHTRLWIAESRTYQYLHKMLTDAAADASLSTKDAWEGNIAKALAVKEICSLKASQHGTDLVVPLSNILNQCANGKNDLAASLALDAIISLCNSNTVNIASTWTAVKNVFHSNRQHRTVKSLCHFFGTVPSLKNPSAAYEALFEESLQRLWNFVIDFDEADYIGVALGALKMYDFSDLMFKHMPAIFTENVKIPEEFKKIIMASVNDPLRAGAPLSAADVVPYIPGECWIELLEKVNQNAIDAAVDLVTHVVDAEIRQFRGGIYLLDDGRPEPSALVQLHARSPLRALVKHVKLQSQRIENPILLTQCLRCLAQKYSRPLPPLNWFFLTEYINLDDQVIQYSIRSEMKKYSMAVAANQIAHSGSARSIICNYVQALDVADCDIEETHMILELTPAICDGITPTILATFLNNTLSFLFGLSKSSKFEVGCSFERAIESLSKVFKTKCLIAENVDIVIDELIKYEALLEADTRIHQRICKFLLGMPAEVLERISTPSTWNLNNYKKSMALRSALITARKPYVNSTTPLMWLNAIIDNSSVGTDHDVNQKQQLLLDKLPEFIHNWSAPDEMCDWLLFCMGKTQAQLNNNSSKTFFSLDFLFYVITIVAGCDAFCPPLNHGNRIHWLAQFPLALDLISRNSYWKDGIVRIYEFLFHLNTQQTDLPEEFISTTCQALICAKNHEYFLRKTTWMKFIDLKK